MLYLYILPETTFEKKNANIPSIGNVNVLTRTDWKSANEKPRPCHCELSFYLSFTDFLIGDVNTMKNLNTQQSRE